MPHISEYHQRMGTVVGYIEECHRRQDMALALRQGGRKLQEIGDALQVSASRASQMIVQARARANKPKPVIFTCAICGIKATEVVLCTRDDCMTPITVHCAASNRKQ